MQAFPELLIVILGGVAAWWVLRRRSVAAELAAQKEAVWLRRMAQQKRVRERLLALNEESLSLLESMPGWVVSAEHHLDQAELDFTERAFAPFWSSVERAVESLAQFDESVKKIESNSSEYVDLFARSKGPAPSFAVSALSPGRMRLATATSHRLQGIVRRAQRDFQFSVIYEHRRSSQILVAGFRSLAQAVEDMASQITASIDRLTTTVERMATGFDESLQREQRVLEVLHRIEEDRYRLAIPGLPASLAKGQETTISLAPSSRTAIRTSTCPSSNSVNASFGHSMSLTPGPASISGMPISSHSRRLSERR